MDAVRMVLVLLLADVVSRVLARLSPIKLPLPLLLAGGDEAVRMKQVAESSGAINNKRKTSAA